MICTADPVINYVILVHRTLCCTLAPAAPTSAHLLLVRREARGAADGAGLLVVPGKPRPPANMLLVAPPGPRPPAAASPGDRGASHVRLVLAVADEDLGAVGQAEVAAEVVDAHHAALTRLLHQEALVYVWWRDIKETLRRH